MFPEETMTLLASPLHEGKGAGGKNENHHF
jgi:hypothetical protein